jgi:hypothetical protein
MCSSKLEMKIKKCKEQKMKLLTEELKKKIPTLYSTDSIPLNEKIVVAKFFNPVGSGTWYVIEGQEVDGDFIFFGLVDLHDQEFGYFSLNELQSICLPFGFKIERDINFSQEKVAKLWEKA